MLSRPRALASLAPLAALAAYVLLFPPHKIAQTHLDSCPMTLGGFPGEVLGLEQTVLDNLNPDDFLIRQYMRPDGLPVWLVIVYFQNARLGAHDPQLCYRSQGYELETYPTGSLPTALGSLPYQVFRADKKDREELVYYFWYTSGGRVLSDLKTWRDQMFFQGVKSNRSFGAFVRVSTLEGRDSGAAREALRAVIQDLAPHLPEFFPEG